MVPPAGTADPAADPVVSVVLCVRNGAGTLRRQLAALARQDVDRPWELVVVDNGSTDGTRALTASWTAAMPWLRVVEEPKPGLDRARNRGVAAATTDRILCCDADDEVDPSWVRALLTGLERGDVVGGALVPSPDASDAARALEVPQADALPTLLGYEFAVGANLGFHRRVFDALDGFDPQFDKGADEVDFCIRAVRAGFTIGFVPDAVVRYARKDRARTLARQRFHYGRGLQRLLAKGDGAGWWRRTPSERARDLVRAKAPLAWTWPRAFRRDQRLPYVALLAHGAGEATELVLLAVRGPAEGADQIEAR
jgi:glycosyltransferase involved in cell wall biosynthesis